MVAQGARPRLDGLSATAFPSGVWGSQIETTEAVAPVLFSKRELRRDSGGAGQFRGGLGQHIEIASTGAQDFMLFLSVERILNPARGRSGGLDGATGRVLMNKGGLAQPDLPGKGEVRVNAGETLVFLTPGGGGIGPPENRDPDVLQCDLRDGLVSTEAAKSIYGVET